MQEKKNKYINLEKETPSSELINHRFLAVLKFPNSLFSSASQTKKKREMQFLLFLQEFNLLVVFFFNYFKVCRREIH